MDEHRHEERSVALGSALQRLSVAREQRGPIGVLDPFEIVPAQERLDAAVPVRSRRRSGLFSFADRARAAADH